MKSIINERIQRYGVSTLTEPEALSAITGISLNDVNTALKTYGLSELIKFSECLNITKSQRKKLELLYHLVRRISVSNYKEKAIIDSSSKAGEYFINELQFFENEVFAIALLDSQNRLIKTEIISFGTINEAPVYPRELVKVVIHNNAHSIILAHVHPGGSLQPSKPDIEVTKKIIEALKTINVSVIDHIIVAEKSFTSFEQVVAIFF